MTLCPRSILLSQTCSACFRVFMQTLYKRFWSQIRRLKMTTLTTHRHPAQCLWLIKKLNKLLLLLELFILASPLNVTVISSERFVFFKLTFQTSVV